jgi:hypothetical protein
MKAVLFFDYYYLTSTVNFDDESDGIEKLITNDEVLDLGRSLKKK